jgi:endo-1,4-beta-D-glucanase Y
MITITAPLCTCQQMQKSVQSDIRYKRQHKSSIEYGGTMLKKVLGTSLLVLACFGSTFAAAKFPFPQQAKYKYGIMPAGVSPKHVQSVYDIWEKEYYTEQGDQARIKFDEPENTVSEGIGYGMLIMVFMDNAQNNTQSKFDKLWKYYNSHLDGKGLMHWKISGFGGTNQSGAATDAELDVAVALIMADKQWGGSYLNDAKSLISKIAASEVSGNVFKGGDEWDGKNPSYMSMVATELFQKVAGGNWSSIQSGCYSLLSQSQNAVTGMWPNWYGSPSVGDNPGVYGFDACRTPWRLGWAYAWYGHSNAQTLCGKIVNWFKSKTSNDPSKIGQIYNLDGSINTGAGGSEDNIPTYLGPLTVAGMVNATYQEWVNKGYTRLRAFGGSNDNYYNECLELLSMLLLSGNMPDFTTATPKSTATLTVAATPASGGSVTVSPQKSSYSMGEEVTITAVPSDANRYTFTGWSGDFEGKTSPATVKVTYDMTITAAFKDASGGDLLDDCEDNDGLTRMGTEWFTYTDVADDGKSTVTPQTERGKTFMTMTSGGYNSDYAVKVTYKLDKGGFEYDPFIGVGFEMKTDLTSLDISKSTGISFAYKGTFGDGDTCSIKCESDAVTELGASYSYTLPGSTSWKEVTITWDEFLQPKWAEAVDLDLKKVPKIQWQIQGSTGQSGEIWLDDIHLVGFDVPVKIACPHGIVRSKGSRAFRCVQSGNRVTVNYNLSRQSNVNVALFDMTGRLVTTVFSGIRSAGEHSAHFDTRTRTLTNNSYIISLVSDNGTFTQQLILAR